MSGCGGGTSVLDEICPSERDTRFDDLDRFRAEYYASLTARADALFELADAVLCADGPVTTLVELCLAGVHRPGRGSLYDGLNAGRDVDVVHMVGGGSQNELLCQLTADACELPVVAGPVEATALGNVLVQARTHKAISGDLWSLRDLVRATQTTRRYGPAQMRDRASS